MSKSNNTNSNLGDFLKSYCQNNMDIILVYKNKNGKKTRLPHTKMWYDPPFNVITLTDFSDDITTELLKCKVESIEACAPMGNPYRRALILLISGCELDTYINKIMDEKQKYMEECRKNTTGPFCC